MNNKIKDIKGQQFGRLTVINNVGSNKYNSILWECRCSCVDKNIIIVDGRNLRNGHTKSCGCLKKEKTFKTRQKMKSNHANFSGKLNPNWNPNLTDKDRLDKRNYPEYKEWVQKVFKRDNYTCQACGDNTGRNLIAHHLESYNSNPELRITLSNGVTLCKTCHKDFHHEYGYGNNTEKQFTKYKGIICI